MPVVEKMESVQVFPKKCLFITRNAVTIHTTKWYLRDVTALHIGSQTLKGRIYLQMKQLTNLDVQVSSNILGSTVYNKNFVKYIII